VNYTEQNKSRTGNTQLPTAGYKSATAASSFWYSSVRLNGNCNTRWNVREMLLISTLFASRISANSSFILSKNALKQKQMQWQTHTLSRT